MDQVRVGVVGTGWMGRAHSHALRTVAALAGTPALPRLTAVAGRRAGATEAFAARHGYGRWSQDWRDIVGADDIDVVANLTPDALHAEVSLAALAAGKDVVCEKPLGRTEAETASMRDAATTAGTLAVTGFNYRYVPAVCLTRRLVSDGRLGAVRRVRARYLQDWAVAADVDAWRLHGELGGGAIGDYCHVLDLVAHLAGPIVGVSGAVVEPRGAGLTEDAYSAVLDLAGGIPASVTASRTAPGCKNELAIELDGTDGSVRWSLEDLNRLWVFDGADGEGKDVSGYRSVLVTEAHHPFGEHWWAPGHILGWEHTFVHQWLDVLAARVGAAPSGKLATFADGHAAARVGAAIVHAWRTGRRAEVG